MFHYKRWPSIEIFFYAQLISNKRIKIVCRLKENRIFINIFETAIWSCYMFMFRYFVFYFSREKDRIVITEGKIRNVYYIFWVGCVRDQLWSQMFVWLGLALALFVWDWTDLIDFSIYCYHLFPINVQVTNYEGFQTCVLNGVARTLTMT